MTSSDTETDKLYWADAFASTFETRGVRVAELGGKPTLVLGQTAFYPESGGQLGDRGTLDVGGHAVSVVDTQVDDRGVIHHVVESALDPARLSEGIVVKGAIDVEHRATQRLKHTAQHMLSRALADVASGPTVSARLGRVASTIDVGLDKLGDAALARAEDLVNAVVRDDVAVRAFFPNEAELATLPLRRAPKVQERIRVVGVGDEGAWFDVTPCGGTHVARTGQIGAVRVTGVERYKGMTRITFLAGGSVIDDARAKERVLTSLARELSCSPFDVPDVLTKLRGELKSERDVATKLRAELATYEAERLLAQHPPSSPSTRIAFVCEDGDLARVRTLAGALATRPDVVAVVSGGASIVVQVGAEAPVDAGALLKKILMSLGGKGGGSPKRAEGRLSEGQVTLEALVNALTVAES